MTSLTALLHHGQAVWLDFLARGFVAKGHLAALVAEGVRGVTSNPAIFEKAIAGSDEYDDAIARLLATGDYSVAEVFEHLAIDDIRAAADVLRPVYDATGGADGYVSLEVSPYLALDTEATVAEARRLWQAVGRNNLMIKVPATPPGLPAIETLLGEGVNVNITLLFAQGVYVQVAQAYLAGLEAFAKKGGDVAKIASVASFFVSRIDTAVDKLLDERIAAANDASEKARLCALEGKAAIANARLAYRHYRRLFAGPRWDKLCERGARPQRLLWASTGTKNKAYRDVLYVEELIGRDTVNTLPPATLDAFRDHGILRASLEEDVAAAERVLADISRAGVSLEAVTDRLVEEGVRLFADAADKLFGAVARKRAALLGDRIGRQRFALGALDRAVEGLAEDWRAGGAVRRLWARDATLWTGGDEQNWLGWLDSVAQGLAQAGVYEAFAREVKRENFTDIVLLGMGGSSLGPEVLANTFGRQPGWPRLRILDSTDPAQVRAVAAAIDLERTLFIVSSKSGSTTEPNMLMAYFFVRVAEALGRAQAGRRFVAVTDPGSSLENTAKAEGFRKIFYGEPSIGGRYSVLSPFGLVPAAAAGVDVKALLAAAETMVRSCGPDVPPAENPGVLLGLTLGAAGRAGRDKVTLLTSPELADFGAWAEQLIAESTGKAGKGLIPVDGEPLAPPEVYGEDRVFIDLRLAGAADAAHEAALTALERAGHPVLRIAQTSPAQIGQEFFRFEIATAVAGAVLGINPFDQPDVEASKIKTRELTAAFARTGALPAETPIAADAEIALYADARHAQALRGDGVDAILKAHLARIRPGDYVALLAYLPREERTTAALQALRILIRDRRRVATSVGFGPRFLHSTGQAFKGGPDTGVFLQITADPDPDLAIPGEPASFGVIEAAQARGDFDVLAERGRRALRLHLKGGLALDALDAALRRALA